MKGVILGMAAVFVWGTSMAAWAGDKEDAGAPKAAPVLEKKNEVREKGRESGKMKGELGEIINVCGLNEEQQKKLIEIDEARIKALKQIMETSVDQIAAMLTPEQKAKWNESMAMRFVKQQFGKASLTDEQITRIKAEIAAKTKDIFLAMNEKNAQLMKNIMAFVNDNVLTDAQRTAVKERPMSMGRDFRRPAGGADRMPVEKMPAEKTPEKKTDGK